MQTTKLRIFAPQMSPSAKCAWDDRPPSPPPFPPSLYFLAFLFANNKAYHKKVCTADS